MALCLINHFFWENEEAKTPFMIVDTAIILLLHFIRKNVKEAEKKVQIGSAKKHEELHQKQKTTDRALKNRDFDKKKKDRNNGLNYKVHEKRTHHKQTRTIQQPSKMS